MSSGVHEYVYGDIFQKRHSLFFVFSDAIMQPFIRDPPQPEAANAPATLTTGSHLGLGGLVRLQSSLRWVSYSQKSIAAESQSNKKIEANKIYIFDFLFEWGKILIQISVYCFSQRGFYVST